MLMTQIALPQQPHHRQHQKKVSFNLPEGGEKENAFKPTRSRRRTKRSCRGSRRHSAMTWYDPFNYLLGLVVHGVRGQHAEKLWDTTNDEKRLLFVKEFGRVIGMPDLARLSDEALLVLIVKKAPWLFYVKGTSTLSKSGITFLYWMSSAEPDDAEPENAAILPPQDSKIVTKAGEASSLSRSSSSGEGKPPAGSRIPFPSPDPTGLRQEAQLNGMFTQMGVGNEKTDPSLSSRSLLGETILSSSGKTTLPSPDGGTRPPASPRRPMVARKPPPSPGSNAAQSNVSDMTSISTTSVDEALVRKLQDAMTVLNEDQKDYFTGFIFLLENTTEGQHDGVTHIASWLEKLITPDPNIQGSRTVVNNAHHESFQAVIAYLKDARTPWKHKGAFLCLGFPNTAEILQRYSVTTGADDITSHSSGCPPP